MGSGSGLGLGLGLGLANRNQLDDLEVLHLQLRDIVHGYLKAHRDRPEILAHVLARILRDETAREQLSSTWVGFGLGARGWAHI